MLKQLWIRDYAVIQSIEIEFGSGLNIITGETGAGKSILIDAVGILLGERANAEVVRKGAQKAVIEAVFDVSKNKKIKNFCSENDIESGDELLLRREISAKGAGRCFINDSPVPLASLKEISDFLVDLHGQHEHQSLLRSATHIDFLDGFAGNELLLKNYSTEYKSLLSLTSTREELRRKEAELKQKYDFISFQLDEISRINPQPGEDEEIKRDLSILENHEKIGELAAAAVGLLYENEINIYEMLSAVKNSLAGLVKFDSSLSQPAEDVQGALASLKEIASTLRAYADKIEFDPNRLEMLRSRAATLQALKKKYGGSLDNVISTKEKLETEISLTDNFEEKIDELDGAIDSARKSSGKYAKELLISRLNAAKKISPGIVSHLKELGISAASFEVKITQNKCGQDDGNAVFDGTQFFAANPRGIDTVEFFISTNKGEDMKPLAKVASGGEISRIMLSLKSVLAKNDKLPILIFDEIDTGVSGRIAQKVGESLSSLSGFHQIIAITHLPQIAAFAESHYVVEKSTTGDRTLSSIRKLSEDEKIREVAKLMSGDKVTEAGIEGAKELMSPARKN